MNSAASTILFIDLDGTCMVNPFARQVFPRVMGMLSQACALPPENLLRQVLAENAHRQTLPNPLSAAWVWDWDQIVQEIAGRHGIPLGVIPLDICAVLARQYAAPPDTATLDEAEVHLCALRAAHRVLNVASMGLNVYQRPVLDALGLTECFDDFLMPDITGFQKTERGFFARYLDDPAAPPHRCYISVGDNFMHDVAAPKRLGFSAVLRLPVPELESLSPFERPAHIEPFSAHIQRYPAETGGVLPDAVIVHLSELAEVVRVLEANAPTG
ncbi:MAG TPA: HAD family hydrolase [Aggregatilineales bacterium]|nr:HAD family hydrolase [Anaerolineales bacterium]HRE47559.1 HAD family hydrolase [Aggregatilineales bacterium]